MSKIGIKKKKTDEITEKDSYWIKKRGTKEDIFFSYECSVCGSNAISNIRSYYCPRCGSKMANSQW